MGKAPYGEVKYLKELSEIIQKTDDGLNQSNILRFQEVSNGLEKWW